MRKSGWAVTAGLGLLALLLTACGGSSSSSASSPTTTPTSSTGPTAAGQPTSAIGGIQPGDVVLGALKSSKYGYVLARANQVVVYVYAKDKKGGLPTCTGSCAATWLPVTVQNEPLAVPGENLPGKLGTVTTADGRKQITYNGYPLYTLKGAGPFLVTGDGVGGVWHVIKLPASVISSG